MFKNKTSLKTKTSLKKKNLNTEWDSNPEWTALDSSTLTITSQKTDLVEHY